MMRDDATQNKDGPLGYCTAGCQEVRCEWRVRSFLNLTWGK